MSPLGYSCFLGWRGVTSVWGSVRSIPTGRSLHLCGDSPSAKNCKREHCSRWPGDSKSALLWDVPWGDEGPLWEMPEYTSVCGTAMCTGTGDARTAMPRISSALASGQEMTLWRRLGGVEVWR